MLAERARRWLVGALWLASTVALSNAEAPSSAFELRSVAFKENGRLDPEILGLCDAKRSVTEGAAIVNAKIKKGPSDQSPVAIDIRIDKIARLGIGNSGVGWGGLEFGITAIVAAQPEVQTHLLCRERVMGAGGRSAYCGSIDACSKDVSKKIVEWLKVVTKE
jgi:hypothetical protein